MMDNIQEIHNKFNVLEAQVNQKLENIRREEEKLEQVMQTLNMRQISTTPALKILTYEEAMIRNATLLKNLEVSKARLRSLSMFSPLEEVLTKALENYKKDIENLQYTNRPMNEF